MLKRELIFGEQHVVPSLPEPVVEAERQPVGYLVATNVFGSTPIELFEGSNSFGEPDIFCGAEPGGGKREFAALRGQPQYAAQTWLRARGYTYEVK